MSEKWLHISLVSINVPISGDSLGNFCDIVVFVFSRVASQKCWLPETEITERHTLILCRRVWCELNMYSNFQFHKQFIYHKLKWNLKSTIFCDITPCSLLKVNRRFGGIYRLHRQGRRITRARNKLQRKWFCIYMQINWLLPSNTVTCRPTARERADKHVSMEVVSWIQRLCFPGYRCSTGISLDTDTLY
jgi:hypothetical protein